MDYVTVALDAGDLAALRERAKAEGVATDGEALARVAAQLLHAVLSPPSLRQRARGGSWRRRAGVGLLLLAAAAVVTAGYAGSWQWTGFPGNPSLWNWLQLVALPIAFGLVALWIRDATMLTWRWRRGLLAGATAFAILVLTGYLVPLAWTGFSGNTLWDWLSLLVLPVTVVTVQAWPQSSRSLRRPHVAMIAVLVGVWAITLVGGYGLGWAWTGYAGNTLWDWLQLLLLPLVVPAVLLPACARWAAGEADARDRAPRPAAPERAEAITPPATPHDASRGAPVVLPADRPG